ncbi:DUF4190 domain-containing protein [Janibacter sp. GS2]|uniref:DUF4190 domain-containing protein n=1 Tax=Janibacter sp. GS2 TaxID=3442646 RepID=UPI003EB745F0
MTNQPAPQTPPSPWAAPRNHANATAALVLGIVGLTMIPGLGIVAWILGAKALQEIDADPQAGWTNREHATIGRILGIVGTILFAAIILVIICYFAVIIVFTGSMASV